MDRYQRVEKPKEETPINENEIRITTQGRMRNYITYATSLLQEKGSNEIVLKAMGRAINKTITIVELIKKRIVGLHQNTVIGSTDITDTWEPLEEGLLPLETTRHVSVMTITLSKTELDTSAVGYQPPLPRDQLKPFTEFEYGEGSPPEQERGYGRRGRGRARGNGPPDYGEGNFDGRGRGYSRGNGPPDYDENWDNRGRGYGRGSYGRGRGQAYRGRGRGGYAGRFDYQQETGSYAYDDEAPVPSQGRGNGPPEYDEDWDNRGRGYGRGGYGRGRGQAYRGRGRGGYAGRFDYQQETSSYAYDDEAPLPSQGRGRGYGRGRGRGRGSIQGRGRNSRPNGVIHAGTDRA